MSKTVTGGFRCRRCGVVWQSSHSCGGINQYPDGDAWLQAEYQRLRERADQAEQTASRLREERDSLLVEREEWQEAGMEDACDQCMDARDEAEKEATRLSERVGELEGALEFYADPETYSAIGFFPEYLPADSVAELVQSADSLAGRVEDIVDTANWQKDPVTVARKLAVPLGKYQAAREAFPTQPEPERKQDG